MKTLNEYIEFVCDEIAESTPFLEMEDIYLLGRTYEKAGKFLFPEWDAFSTADIGMAYNSAKRFKSNQITPTP